MGNKSMKNWNENDIRLYLSEEFPDASQDLVNQVTKAIVTEGKDRIQQVLSSYRTQHNFSRFSNFKSIDHGQQYQVASMLEGVHRRFIGNTYESMSTTS